MVAYKPKYLIGLGHMHDRN